MSIRTINRGLGSSMLEKNCTFKIFPMANERHICMFFPLFYSCLTTSQDMSQQPPWQELVATDLHSNEWHFRHIFRGEKTCM